MSANYTPEKEDLKILTPFKMQVLTNFPYIEADFDALTNYQLLCKVVENLNNVITETNEVTEQTVSLYNAYVSLQTYVNNYFDNLNLQTEVNKKLDEMAEDGSLTNLIKAYIDPIYQDYEVAINARLDGQDTEISDFKSSVNSQIAIIDNKVDSATSGSPLVASSTAGMTDTTRVYVNTTDGNWYYYDGDSWEIGGIYQATAIDPDNPIISGLTDSVETLEEDMSHLMVMKPYDRQLFNVDTMLPETANKLSISTSTLTMVTAELYRCYPIEVNGKSGDIYSFNFVNFSGTLTDLIYVASDVLPEANAVGLQLGTASMAYKRGTITLAQDSKYLLIFIRLSTPTSPEADVTTACNGAMDYLVLRKGDYPSNVEYYEYEEYIDYKVVPYDQGVDNAGKILSVDDNGILKPLTVENVGGNISYAATSTIYVGDNLISSDTPVVLGTGWSGNYNSGFTHTAGFTNAMEFNFTTDLGDKYLVDITGSNDGNGHIGIQIGNEPVVDVYNGTTSMSAGIVSDGGKLKIVPLNPNLSVTITNVKLRKVQNSGTEITLQTKNVNQGQMDDNITGFWNVAFGNQQTLAKNQNASRNIAIGLMSESELKSGTRNIGIGTFAMAYVKEGDRNVAIGADTLYDTNPLGNSRKAYDNIAIGKATMKSGSNIKENIAMGTAAMADNTDTSYRNVAIGVEAGSYAANENTHVGYRAGYYTKGNGNTSIGHKAMSDVFNTGDNNIAIGNGAGTKADNSSSTNIVTINNSIAIGTNVKAKASNQVVIGDSSQTIILGSKRLIFNNDGSISWTSTI